VIELYGMSSPNVQKVTLMLEETELPYRFTFVNVFKGEQFADSFRALNPNIKVPVIVDSDGPDGKPFTLFESGAILMYLAEKTGKFWPVEARARHTVTQWLMIQMGGIGPMSGQYIHFMRFAPPGNEYGLKRYGTEVKRLHGVMEQRLGESAYIGGPDYGIADMAFWPWMLNPILAVAMDQYPNIARWSAAIAARPAAQRMQKWLAGVPRADFKKLQDESPEDLDRYFGRGKYSRV